LGKIHYQFVCENSYMTSLPHSYMQENSYMTSLPNYISVVILVAKMQDAPYPFMISMETILKVSTCVTS